MEDLLIDTLSYFNFPVIRQGCMGADEEYPNDFFTFWNNSSDDESFYDNQPAGTAWDFDVNFYSSDPNNVSTYLIRAIEELRKVGFIISGKGYDVASDEPSHIGRGINAIYIERNNLKED